MKQTKLVAAVALLSIMIMGGFATADQGFELGQGAQLHTNANLGVYTHSGNEDANGNVNIYATHLAPEKSHVVVQSDNNVVSIEDFNNSNNQDFNSTSITDASNEIDDSVSMNALESTFAQVSLGQGWAIIQNTSNISGYFAKIFWVEKTFVLTNQTDNTTSNGTTMVMGSLKIGSTLYNLNMTSETNNTITFDVMKNKNVVGTLTLDQTVSLLGFSVWSGILNLNSGQSYSINLATQNSKLKSLNPSIGKINGSAGITAGQLNAAQNGQGKKLGLWDRIRTFFGAK